MKAVIPVAGNGTRMYPLGVDTPKPLLKILNKPIIEWSLESMAISGIDEVVVITSAGKFGGQIKEFLQQIQMDGMKIHVAEQEQQLGTAHVLQVVKDYFQPDEEFIFVYGDDLYGPKNIQEILNHQGLVVMGKPVNDPEKWGIFQTDENKRLIKVIEKPQSEVGNLANIGCMKLSAKVFEIFEQLTVSPRGEYELTDSLQILADQNEVKVIETVDYWIPVGYPWHILEATEYFLAEIDANIDGKIDKNVHIEGRIILPASSKILSGTVIEGNVLIGENVVIGPNAYIRGSNVIGNNCKIGFSVELKNSVVYDNTQIAHLSYIGDSILGKSVNVAGGTIVANFRHDEEEIKTPVKEVLTTTGRKKFGTVIGSNVKLGIGTKIYPGRKIWPNKTTLPGEIVDKDLIT